MFFVNWTKPKSKLDFFFIRQLSPYIGPTVYDDGKYKHSLVEICSSQDRASSVNRYISLQTIQKQAIIIVSNYWISPWYKQQRRTLKVTNKDNKINKFNCFLWIAWNQIWRYARLNIIKMICFPLRSNLK